MPASRTVNATASIVKHPKPDAYFRDSTHCITGVTIPSSCFAVYLHVDA
jgi:hypothetical protein